MQTITPIYSVRTDTTGAITITREADGEPTVQLVTTAKALWTLVGRAQRLRDERGSGKAWTAFLDALAEVEHE